jgi:hypothetical protein
VGLLILTGRRQVKGPAPDRLFAITNSQLESERRSSRGQAAIVFQALATSELRTHRDMEEVVEATGGGAGPRATQGDTTATAG